MVKEINKNNLQQQYNALVKSKMIREDQAQSTVLAALQQTAEKIYKYREKRGAGFILKKLFGKAEKPPKGMYIWGGVGRGKSMLMDLFFGSLEVKRKSRVHFHAFMLDVHARIHEWRKNNSGDPLPKVAEAIAKESWVLCFDELQVTDIGDAMILGRLFKHLFAYGVVVIATSNRPPDDLYKDGLQRDRFLPFIDIFKQKLDVIELGGKDDYRLKHLKALKTVYMTPIGKKSDKFLEKAFAELTNNAAPEKKSLKLNGREIVINKTAGKIAWCDFEELCAQPLGAEDYGEIAREFSTVLLGNIPKMNKEKRNEAKRFVTLIDELYEHKTKLICVADAKPDKLYPAGDGSFEFARTASRLIEMQSDKYLKAAHLG